MTHALTIVALIVLIATAVRSVSRRSPLLARIFILGLMARVVGGVALFLISYYQWPVAASLQAGGGFWTLAADARGYYQLAADTALNGTPIIDAALPSPFFIRTLAWWMMAVGVHPLSGMLLNICMYAAAVFAIVRSFEPVNDWRRDLPCAVCVAGLSFSPVIVIHATQPLKDELFSFLVIVSSLGVLALRRLPERNAGGEWGWVVAGCAALAFATFGTAGIRWYYALLLWSAAAMSLVACGLWRLTARLPAYLGATSIALLAGWLGLWAGSGPYYQTIRAYLALGPAHLATVTQLSRRGFLMTGGATNVVVPLRTDPNVGKAHELDLVAEQIDSEKKLRKQEPAGSRATTDVPSTKAAPPQPTVPTAEGLAAAERVRSEQLHAARAIPVTAFDHLIAAASGLSLIVLPASIALRLFGVEIAGGRGLLPIADLDTVFQDLTIAVLAVLLWKRRHLIQDRLPLVVFSIVVSASGAFLLAYVVTNFGTMWRLRSLVTVPFWMAALALSPRKGSS